MLRLAQALARLRFADIVEHGDVDEALRLMECSKESLEDDEDKEYEPDRSVISQIFRLIKNMAGEGGGKRRKRQHKFGKGPGGERDMDVDSSEDDNDGELALIDVRSRVLGAGYTEAQLNDTIAEVGWCFILHTARHSPSPRSMSPSTSGHAWQMARSCVSSMCSEKFLVSFLCCAFDRKVYVTTPPQRIYAEICS